MRAKVELIESKPLEDGAKMYLYEATIELPRRVTLAEIGAARRFLEAELRKGRPGLVPWESPITLEAIDAPYAGAIGISVTVRGSMAWLCAHLADSDEPNERLTEACPICGRYFVDE